MAGGRVAIFAVVGASGREFVSVQATVLLALALNETAQGEINYLGLNWTVIGPPPLPAHVVTALIDGEEDYADTTHEMEIRLERRDGSPAEIVLSDGVTHIGVGTRVRMTPTDKPAARPNMGRRIALSMNVNQGMPLPSGYYRYALRIDDQEEPVAFTEFYVRDKPDEFAERPSQPSIEALD